jgi:hypothetical protein
VNVSDSKHNHSLYAVIDSKLAAIAASAEAPLAWYGEWSKLGPQSTLRPDPSPAQRHAPCSTAALRRADLRTGAPCARWPAKDLLPDPEYAYLDDPYWVSAYPYRVDVTKDDVQTIRVTVRNFRATPQQHRVALKLPPGLTAEPAVLEGVVGPRSRQSYPVALKVTERAALAPGVQIVPFDITLDGKRYGELFDFLILGRDQAP